MKAAFVTGAGNGIGAVIAEHAARAGYRVAVVDADAEAAAKRAESLPDAVALPADVTDEAQVEAALEQFGTVPDLLVNCAGIVRFGPLIEQSVADFRRVIDVDLVGAYIVARAVAKRMVPRGTGAMVNITSINGITPGPNAGAYPAAKAGLAMLTQHFAVELGPSGIRVNAVAPGFIDAGMSAPFFADPKVRQVRGSGVPLRSLGTPEDIAEAVMFLASDAARYVNGHQLVVDGGVVGSLLAALPREPR